jgi:hypothetical protein
LKAIAEMLEHFLDFLVQEYAVQAPNYFITVYLLPRTDDLLDFSSRVHGLRVDRAIVGYSFLNDMSIVARSDSGGGTLTHELTHLLLRSSLGATPQWLDEGIASLYESATAVNGRYFGDPNWRSLVVNELMREYPRVGLREVIVSRWFADRPADGNDARSSRYVDPNLQAYILALGRYFAMYLQEQNKLRKMFDAYRDYGPDDSMRTFDAVSVSLVESVTGEALEKTQAAFLSWYQKYEQRPGTSQHGG